MRLKGKSMHLHIVYCLSKKTKNKPKKAVPGSPHCSFVSPSLGGPGRLSAVALIHFNAVLVNKYFNCERLKKKKKQQKYEYSILLVCVCMFMHITANNLVSCLTKRGVRCVHDTACGNANATEYMTVMMTAFP